MRPAADMPQGASRPVFTRWRVVIGVVVVVLLVLLFSLRGLASFWTDYLWFDSLGFGTVWRDVLLARIGLGALFTAIFFAFCMVNLVIADRIAPRLRPPGPEEELVQRWRQFVGGRVWLVRVLVAGLLGLIAGAGVSGRWEQLLLFVNRVDFGIDDPQFGRDVGFYVFQLPFLTFLVTWTFTAIVTVSIVTAVAHFLNGGIRLQTRGQRVTPQVKAHLSLLLGLLALVKAAGYYLDRFELVLSTRGFRDGAAYTDVNAQLPAISLLILISIFSFGLLIFNIWARGWTYPAAAVGLWALVAFVAGTLYPALVQRFQVEPVESRREAPFIERNIEATRFAMGIDEVVPRTFSYEPSLDVAELEGNRDAIDSVRLLDPGIIEDTFQELQGFRGFYDFRDVDVDRYTIDGAVTQVVVSARELSPSGLPNRSWESERVAFTHGYGLAIAPANEVDRTGEPGFLVGDIPVSSPPGEPTLALPQPAIYFGEDHNGYVVVGAERNEVDFEGDAGTRDVVRYLDDLDGTGGVGVSGSGITGLVRRAAFALRFGEPNLLISGQVRADSRILYIRDIRERIETLAPFLSLDGDPYPAIVDGRTVWIVDAYTTTARYPYAQRADRVGISGTSGLPSDFNYVRNSVKITVDAIDGDVEFWVVDPDDPMVQAYRKIFPVLFSDDPPAELVAHFRYPEDLFRVQTNMWGRYRLSDPTGFYEAGAAWDVAQDPGTSIAETTTETVQDEQGVIRQIEGRIDPQYLHLRLPGDAEKSFLLFRPFTPIRQEEEGISESARRNLTGFMVARSDPENYGTLEVFDVTSTGGDTVRGPVQFDDQAQATSEIGEFISLLNQQGSSVRAGNLLLIPIENSLAYVRPLYVAATGDSAFPRLQQVIVGIGESIAMRPTLTEALNAVIPGLDLPVEGGPSPAPPLPDEGTGDGDGEDALPEDVAELLTEASDAFQRADEALADGDLAAFQREVERARAAIAAAEERLAAETEADAPTDGSTPDEGDPSGDGEPPDDGEPAGEGDGSAEA